MSDGWRYLFVVLLWVIIQGCERQVADERLRCIDVLTSDNPQQTIVMLDSVDRGSLNEYNRHYYDLLTIKAIDKAFIQHTSDSLYLTVLDYFERHKNAPIYPEVLYYGGRVYSDMGDYPRALEFFQKTLSEIGGNDDKSELRLNAMSQTGRLLNIMRLYDESLPYLKECVEVDSKIGDSTTLAYDYQLLATVLRNKEEYDATAAYYTKTSVTEGIAGYPFFHFNWGFAGDYNGWYLTTGTWTAGGITYKTTNAIVDIYYK